MATSPEELDYLTARYAAARNRYKPAHIRLLLLAEAPPGNLERYFYFEDVKQHDSLFLEITGILYPDRKKRYLSSGRDEALKRDLLREFAAGGFWLTTVYETPGLSEAENAAPLPGLLKRLNAIDKATPILLIGAPTYDTCYAPLSKAGYRVLNERIPFPGSGQQKVFRAGFKKAIDPWL